MKMEIKDITTRKAFTDPTFGKCDQCAGELDYRDIYRNNLCSKCRREQDAINRKVFLATLHMLPVEERLNRLEELLYDHQSGHPNKELQW